ncbi:MAG: FtsQ-type POTRA domain-containing protein [Oscillospiraceae bacterium]|nr:FtsQ-type POTRA domain-containing protein [Oscillospiraceae bacterium]
MPGERKRRRRGRYSFLLTFFVAAALIFAFVLTSGFFFKIKHIEFEGVSVTSQAKIKELLGFSEGDHIFLINKSGSANSILANMPYVKTVRIKRSLPGTVLVIITEAEPAAMIEYRGEVWLFDAQGKLLESVASYNTPDLPVVTGFELFSPMEGTTIYPAFEDTAKKEPLLELLQTMREEGIWEGVGEIDLTQISNICFTYNEIYTVELGLPNKFDRKIQIMNQALQDEKVSGRGAGTLYLADAGEKPVRFVPGGD